VAASSNLLTQGFRSFMAIQNTINEDLQDIIAIESMIRDLHAIRSTSDITAANSTSITFNVTTGNTITYNVNGTSIGRTEQGSYQPLADNEPNLTIGYYDATGTTVNTSNTTSTIRYITVTANSTTPIEPVITVHPWNMQ
jgi:hypothetical protein